MSTMSEIKIVFLGTGSGRPTLRRNCAAVYLQWGGDAALFDCGEGAQMQLMRASVKTSRLVAICITHAHGDHINGLPGFLGTMGMNGHREPLTLCGPEGIRRYLRTLAELRILRPSFAIDAQENRPGVMVDGPGFQIHACRLDHRVPCHGFLWVEDDRPGRFNLERARELGIPPGPLYGVLQRGGDVTVGERTFTPEDVLGPARPGRRIAYISDTRPSDAVVDFARGADVLIHEATYLHEHHADAVERGHSTVRETAEIAARAEVKHLVLTHISSKHGRRRELLDEARPIFRNTTLAEDLEELVLPRET